MLYSLGWNENKPLNLSGFHKYQFISQSCRLGFCFGDVTAFMATPRLVDCQCLAQSQLCYRGRVSTVRQMTDLRAPASRCPHF